jgi:predicted fused transcriptional regulator/phosphomethylpyrimidine kinase
MTGSNFMDFVEALKSDPALKERVQQARQEATTNIRREADAIAAIARDAGFDINEPNRRKEHSKSIRFRMFTYLLSHVYLYRRAR